MMDTERNYWRYMAGLEARQAARWKFQEEHPGEVSFPPTSSIKTQTPEIGFVSQDGSTDPKPAPPESPAQSPAPPPIRDDV